MERALDEFIVEGIKTTIPFHKELMQNEQFKKGDFNTGFLNDYFEKKEKEQVAS
jgi:acetyl-CoA carboxylase biotin carboxylase subunit